MPRLLEGKHLLEGGAYFNVDTLRCSAYQREDLIWGPALIRGNTVNYFNCSLSFDGWGSVRALTWLLLDLVLYLLMEIMYSKTWFKYVEANLRVRFMLFNNLHDLMDNPLMILNSFGSNNNDNNSLHSADVTQINNCIESFP